MIKTVKRVIVLMLMIVLGVSSVFAQAESNTYKATFEQFTTDVDKFFHVNNWSSTEFDHFFGYTRFGANIPAGVIDAGVAAKAGSLYLALYYNGKVIGLDEGPSYVTKVNLDQYDSNNKKKTETINLNAKNKVNPNATYGALVGIRNLGFKFTLEDNLSVDGTPVDLTNPTPPPNTETWAGSITPKVTVGLPGKLYRIILGVPIVYARTEDAKVNRDPNGDYVSFTTTTNKKGNDAKTATAASDPTAASDLLDTDADGNYVQVDLMLRFGGFKLGFTDLYLDNRLKFNIFGVPGRDIDGKEKMYMGVANVSSNYYPFKDASGVNMSDYEVTFDNRFWLYEEITPSFDIVNGTSGKFAYIVNFLMPISFEFENHALNYLSETKYDNPMGLGKKVEVTDYYKRFDFDMGISPEVDVGVQFKPADILTLQAGVGLNLFTWAVSAQTETEVKEPEDPASTAWQKADQAGALGNYSTDRSTTEFNFGYPDLRFALGFTLNIKKIAALDFVYLNRFNPSLAGLAYKAIGEGLGSGDTSVVLSIKF